MKKVSLILDSNSILYRVFFALPPLKTKKGEPTGAIYGFLLVFFKVIKELKPNYICACFDHPRPTFRHQKYKEYKITRPKIPQELKSQILKTKEILKAFSVPLFEKEGFEADDLIGTIVERIKKEDPNVENIILSGDKDLLQLIDDSTKIYLLKGHKEKILFDKELLKQEYQGLTPKQIPHFKSLVGDPSDNLPGVPGIGEKTALNLLKNFYSIENLYEALEKKNEKSKKIPPKIRETLLRQKELVFFSKSLIEIKKDVPIEFNLEKCRWKDFNEEKIVKILEELEFKSLIGKISELKLKEKTKEDYFTQKSLF